MTDRDALVRGYAEALFAAARAEGEADALEAELFAFGKALGRETQVRDALLDPALPGENKRALVRDLLGERGSPRAASMVGFVVDQGRARELPAILEAFAEVAAASRSEVLAEVRSAVPLDGAQRERLAAALGRSTGRAVDLQVVVDPTVIGGVVAKVGDEVFDSSIRGRLADVRDRMSGR
ncbi:MAG: ATP synthase F1 subunit delta [Actinomycetota bacterium]